jgi:uncharacterized membrane protein
MTWAQRFKLRDTIASSIWIIPALCTVGAIVLAAFSEEIDQEIFADLTEDDVWFIYSPSAALEVLASIAAGMIAFTGFVFSILTLAVQFGSTQFSPRSLRPLQRGLTTKVALGSFIATFMFSLLVLSDVGAGDERYVPALSVLLAIFLLLISVGLFLQLLHSVITGLRAVAVMDRIAGQTRRQIHRAFPPLSPIAPAAREPEPLNPADGRLIRFRGSPGIIQAVNVRGLVAVARRADAVIELIPAVGDYVAMGAPLARVYEKKKRIRPRQIYLSVAVGDERTVSQDPAYGIRLLVDIAIKALSAAINDPTTAVQAIDRIDDLIRRLGLRQLDARVRFDRRGAERLRLPVHSWDDLLDLALDEIRHYGVSSIQVTRRLYALLDDLRETLPPVRHAALDAEREKLDRAVDQAFEDELDRRNAKVPDRQGIGMARPAR